MRRLCLPLLVLAVPLTAQADDALLTVAESSEYRATGYHKDVMAFVRALAKKAPDVVRLGELGKTFLGKQIPLIIMARPAIANAAEARRSGKLIAYAQGGIHSGECCGKEALQMLARDIATTPEHPLLKDLVIVFAPLYNADGNDRMKKTNRRGQKGPADGMGVRPNGQGYDLNRDNTKLESPEAQGLARFMTEWDPQLVIDTHTTNGSYHQNTLTFDGPVNPAGDAAIIDFVRDNYLPAVSRSVSDATGFKSTFYGNSNRSKTRWTTYDGRPRFGTRARGIRGVVSILTEAYSYAPYKDRVLCTKAFVEHLLTYMADHKTTFRTLYADVRARVSKAGNDPQDHDLVALRIRSVRIDKDIVIHGFVEKAREGATGRRRRPVPTGEKKTYQMEHWGAYESALAVRRPWAYVYPATLTGLTEKLEQHGIEVTTLENATETAVEVYKVTEIRKDRRSFQKHLLNTVDVAARTERRTLPTGSMVVRTGHHLGNLIVYLLEPQADDGLTAWNFLDHAIAEGKDHPVVRVMRPFDNDKR